MCSLKCTLRMHIENKSRRNSNSRIKTEIRGHNDSVAFIVFRIWAQILLSLGELCFEMFAVTVTAFNL